MSEVGRAIEESDRKRILATLTQWSASGSISALRTKALVLLVWGSALRLNEALALDIDQVLEDPTGHTLGRLRSHGYVRAEQAKGRRKGPARWTSSGAFIVTQPARSALRAYLAEAVTRGWLTFPVAKGTPLFLTIKGGSNRRTGPLRVRLGKRAAQYSWAKLQLRAKVANPYRFHDLRHDALTRFGDAANGNVFKVASFGRLKDIRTAQRYVHSSVVSLTELAEIASMPVARRAHR